MPHSSPSALGYKVNCAAREGPPEEPLGMSHSSPSALGYKVNCAARQGESPSGERRPPGGEGPLGHVVRNADYGRNRRQTFQAIRRQFRR